MSLWCQFYSSVVCRTYTHDNFLLFCLCHCLVFALLFLAQISEVSRKHDGEVSLSLEARKLASRVAQCASLTETKTKEIAAIAHLHETYTKVSLFCLCDDIAMYFWLKYAVIIRFCALILLPWLANALPTEFFSSDLLQVLLSNFRKLWNIIDGWKKCRSLKDDYCTTMCSWNAPSCVAVRQYALAH